MYEIQFVILPLLVIGVERTTLEMEDLQQKGEEIVVKAVVQHVLEVSNNGDVLILVQVLAILIKVV